MPALSIPTNLAQVEAWAGALYGSAVGQTTMNQINSDIVSYGGLNNTLNAYYSSAFGSLTTAAVAASVVTNLGIVAGQNGLVAADVNQANLYVVGVLNGTAANARGVAIANVVSLFNGLAGTTGALANFSAAATAWVGTVANSIAYNGSNATDNTFTVAAATVATQNASAAALAASAAAAAVAAKSATLSTPLTVGTDTIVASTNAISVSGTAGVSTTGAQPTFTAGDSITGLTGVTTNALNVTDQTTGATWTPTSLGAITISGIQNVTYSSGEAVTVNTTSAGGSQGYTGLSSLGVYGSGGLNVTTGSSVVVSATDNSAAATNESVTGGSSVTLTVNGITTGVGSITVGTSTAAPQGAVTVTTSQTAVAANSYTSDKITIIGGTVDTVNETIPLGLSTTLANYVNTGGAVIVTGQLPVSASTATATNSNPTGTTSVSVTQSKVAASTFTMSLSGFTLANTKVLTVTDSAGNTITLTNNTGGNKVLTANQVAQAIYAAAQTTAPTLLVNDLTVGGTGRTSFGFSIGAPSSGSTTLVLTAKTTTGVTWGVPTIINDAAGANTAVGSAIAATGGSYDNIVTISDANATSTTAASTIGTVTLSGLSFDTNGIGSVINSSALQNLSITNASSGAKVTINNNVTGTTNTVLNLTLNGSTFSTSTNFVDTNAEIKTLNITTSGSGTTGMSSLTLGSGFANLHTLTVKGSGALTMGALTSAGNLSSFTISGGASVSADATNNTAFLKTITSTSTGQGVFSIDPRYQSYVHTGSGQDIVTIGFTATQPVTAGTATNNMIIWNAAAPTSLGTVTGFTTLGVGAVASGTFNMSLLSNASNNFNALDIIGGNASGGNVVFSNVVPNTSLAIDSSVGTAFPTASTATVNYTTTGTTGATNSLNLTLGVSATDPRGTVNVGAASATKFSTTMVSTLTLADSAAIQTVANGVGTVNISSWDSYFGQANTIGTLSDTGLTSLSISGTGAVAITTFSTDLAATLSINNSSSSTAWSTITNLTDNNLSSLTITGNGLFGASGSQTLPAITQTFNINDANSSLTITNNNTNPLTITAADLRAVSGATGGPGVTNLGFAGSTAQTVTTLNLAGTALETLTSTDSGLVTIASLGDTSLTNLNINGTGNITISTIDGAATKTIIDNNTGTLTISADSAVDTTPTAMNNTTGVFIYNAGTQASETSMTLVGNVAYTVTGAVKLATVNGPSDNANNSITLGNSTAASTPTITLGNGNNTISDSSTTLGGSFTLGSGSNTISVSTLLATGKNVAMSFSAHTGGSDNITVSGEVDFATVAGFTIGTTTANTLVAGDTINFLTPAVSAVAAGGAGVEVAANTTATFVGLTTMTGIVPGMLITGAISGIAIPAGDYVGSIAANGITINTSAGVADTTTMASINGAKATTTDTAAFGALVGSAASGTIATTAQFSGSPTSTLAQTIAAAEGACLANGTASFIYGGNTYIVNDAGLNAPGTSTSVVQLMGVHTISSSVNGVVTILT